MPGGVKEGGAVNFLLADKRSVVELPLKEPAPSICLSELPGALDELIVRIGLAGGEGEDEKERKGEKVRRIGIGIGLF
ncbi:MAG: hypothetical protein Fur0022_15780 [Anaerolineales bacterium]